MRLSNFKKFILNRILKQSIRKSAFEDFEEQYLFFTEIKGKLKADIWYWLQIICLFPSFIKNSFYWSFIMFKSYLKIAVRNIKKHKAHSFINITGLAIGICLFILIMIFVQNEFSYDKFNKNIDRIFKVVGREGDQPSMAPAIGKRIAETIPEAEKVVRFKLRHDYLVQHQPPGNQENSVSTIIRDFGWADSTIFDIFTLLFINGDPRTALQAPFSIVLTESIAERVFGNENPLGKTIRVNNSHDYHITGVIKDPKNFHLSFDVLASFVTLGKTIDQSELDSYNSWNLATYVLLPENHNAIIVADKISVLFKEKIFELFNRDFYFKLQPLKELYFSSPAGSEKHGNIQTVYTFIAIAIFVLLIACINFINLSTARASIRAKEVGIKKVVGSKKTSLIFQFLSESVLFSLFALLIAILLVYILLPTFNNLIQKELSFNPLQNTFFALILIVGVFLVGIVSGIYPAFYLSAFNPNAVLKGEKTKGSGSLLFRRVLIIFQFAISIVLIIGTLTIFKQINFVKNKDLGFNKEHILNFDIHRNETIRNNKQVFRERLLRSPNILSATYSQGYPGRIYNWESFDFKEKRIGGPIFTVEPEFFDLFGLNVVEGRTFSRNFKTDEFSTCVINEAAAKELGQESPVGKFLHNRSVNGSSFPVNDIKIIGVVKDFHLQSLHEQIRPLIFGWNDPWLWMASVKISSNNIPETIEYIKNLWFEYSPEFPLEYHFFDETFNAQYKSEERFGKIFGYFAILGIFIACLGLFGLASFMAEQRTKEIGIRKVLGASVAKVVSILTQDFIKWVLIANVIAWPIAYLVMNKWLQNFAYKTNIGLVLFLCSAILVLLIALVTVSYQSIKAALANPVKSLKYE